MPNAKEVTIYDIARKLNVSAATVSRSLQDHPAISQKTKKKIADTVDALGYRTNHFARNLRQQQTKTIGVSVHELNSSFMTSVLAGIEKVTTEAGYDILIAHSSENVRKEAANAKNLFHKRVDGLIASLSFETTHLDHFQPYVEKGVPVVFFDRVEQNGHNTVVIIDNAKCGHQATRHLISQGCRRIAHITSSLQRNVYAERFKGYKQALSDGGLTFDGNLVVIADLSEEAAVESAKKILAMKPLPDGLFITNDFVAAVTMRTLKEAGVRIPHDIAVVGFNNDAVSKLVEPQLTTINYPGRDIGEIAARHLVNHLKGTGSLLQTNTVVVRSELVVRASSLKPGRE